MYFVRDEKYRLNQTQKQVERTDQLRLQEEYEDAEEVITSGSPMVLLVLGIEPATLRLIAATVYQRAL